MMEAHILVDCIPDRKRAGSQEKRVVFSATAGENLFLNGSLKRCDALFEALCGLRRPEFGEVQICGTNPYTLHAREAAAFRRDTIGGIPRGGGLIAEVRMIEQIALPLMLAGVSDEEVLTRVRALTDFLLPLHDLYNVPGRCNARKQAHAAILRAVICEPRLIVLNGLLDELPNQDADALWRVITKLRPPDSILIYLSGAPAPTQMTWTQQFFI